MALLKTENLTINFGGVIAVNNVSIEIEALKIYGIIGPNGAGKTTLFNLISGVYEPTGGTVSFDGKNINELKPYQRNVIGISRTYQVINLFRKMSVLDNILVGMHPKMKTGFISSLIHTKKERIEEAESHKTAMEWLKFIGLAHRAEELSGSLSYGEQRLLEIGRALAGQPKLLLLDEPAAGMNDTEKESLRQLILRIRNELGVTVLVIEHDMKLMMNLAEFIYVLNFGKLLAKGTPAEIQNNPDVITAYLGG